METLHATDAKREFGEVLLRAQKEPVGINENGKPVAVMVLATEYETLTVLNEEWLKAELQKGLDDLQAGRVTRSHGMSKKAGYECRFISSPSKLIRS